MPLPDISAALEKVSRTLQKSSSHLQWIKAQHKDGVKLIPVSDVYYLKATDKYTTVRTREGEFLIRKTIKELEEELDPELFWRVHRAAAMTKVIPLRRLPRVDDPFDARHVGAWYDHNVGRSLLFSETSDESGSLFQHRRHEPLLLRDDYKHRGGVSANMKGRIRREKVSRTFIATRLLVIRGKARLQLGWCGTTQRCIPTVKHAPHRNDTREVAWREANGREVR